MVGRFFVTPSLRTPYDVFAWLRADSLANDVDTPHEYQRAAGRLSSAQMLHNDWRHRHFYVNIHETKDRYSRIKGGHWKRIDKRVKERKWIRLPSTSSREKQRISNRTQGLLSHTTQLQSRMSVSIMIVGFLRGVKNLFYTDNVLVKFVRQKLKLFASSPWNICWLANDISLT